MQLSSWYCQHIWVAFIYSMDHPPKMLKEKQLGVKRSTTYVNNACTVFFVRDADREATLGGRLVVSGYAVLKKSNSGWFRETAEHQ